MYNLKYKKVMFELETLEEVQKVIDNKGIDDFTVEYITVRKVPKETFLNRKDVDKLPYFFDLLYDIKTKEDLLYQLNDNHDIQLQELAHEYNLLEKVSNDN